ncbi:MAG TPA: hypothetical protein VE912_16570 [Bacteroidales bacterium]|nr:hypothetical protein [Bacteroidales bacterium]
MKTSGIILLIIGIVGTVIFGVQALNNSEHFNLLGINVAVSSANWTPVIISAVVLIIGIILIIGGKK